MTLHFSQIDLTDARTFMALSSGAKGRGCVPKLAFDCKHQDAASIETPPAQPRRGRLTASATSSDLLTRAAEALVIMGNEVALDLLDSVQRDAHHDEQTRAAEAERHVELGL